MPPKPKRRKGAKETEEELLINERLTEIFFKYKQEHESSDDEAVGMFEDETQKINTKDLESVLREVGVAEWDPSVMVLLEKEEKESNRVDIEKIKLMLMTLITVSKQLDDIEYLFKTFSDPESKLITHESLSRSLKHLNIRETSEKVSLLLAFAHEQSFLQLILEEQTMGQSLSMGADKSGVNFEEFKRTFIRSTFLANKL